MRLLEIEKLAVDIDTFAYENDFYDYQDEVEDREQELQKLKQVLMYGETESIESWLQVFVHEGEPEETVSEAQHLIDRIHQAKKKEYGNVTEEESIVGKQFDRLKVLEYAGKTSYGEHVWKCLCDCGKTVMRNQKTLENTSRFHSCGCYTKENLIPGNRELMSKAGRQRAVKRNINGVNMDMLDNSKNITTNTSGHKGISWNKSANKWHVYIGYKNYRCTLAYVEDLRDAVQIREAAVEAVRKEAFDDFFFQLRGFKIEDKLTKSPKKKRSMQYDPK